MKNKYLEWKCEFFFLRFSFFSSVMQSVNLTTFSTLKSAEIKDNIPFAASPIDRTDGNCWTTAEIETQPQNSPEVGLLPHTTLLLLERIVKDRSVCTQHVFWVENTGYFLGPEFLRSELQGWWSTVVKGGDLNIMFCLSLLLNRNLALISASSVRALEFSVNMSCWTATTWLRRGKKMYTPNLWYGVVPLPDTFPCDPLSSVTLQQVAWKGIFAKIYFWPKNILLIALIIALKSPKWALRQKSPLLIPLCDVMLLK